MLGAALDKAAGLFERRFLATAFFPALMFWGLVLTIILATTGDLAGAARALGDQQLTVTTLAAVGFIIWVTFFAVVVGSIQIDLLKLFEGYWQFPLGRQLADRGTRWHRAKLKRLGSTGGEAYAEVYFGYPPVDGLDKVMPTRLGNILRSMELYPLDRYGVDAVVFWPRLYPLLPDRFAEGVAGQRALLDGAVVIATLAAVFTLGMGAYTALAGAAWWLFASVVGGGTLVASLAYRAAIGNAVTYSEQVKTAFDLYRFDVPTQMHMPLPAHATEEEAYWTELGLHLYRMGREHRDWAIWNYVSGTVSTSLGRATEPLPPAEGTPPLWSRLKKLIFGDRPAVPSGGNAPAVAAIQAVEEPPSDGGWPLGRWLIGLATVGGVIGSIILFRGELQAQRILPVPVHELAAYRPIDAADLTGRPFPARGVPTTAARSAPELIGRYSLDPIAPATPIAVDRLGPRIDPTQLANTYSIAIAATPSLSLGGTLRAGERVDLTFVPTARDATLPGATVRVFSDILVLDVRWQSSPTGVDVRTPAPTRTPEPTTIVLAVPADRRDEFVKAAATSTLALARHT